MKYQIPPAKLNWITPYLIVQNMQHSLDFYNQVFSFDIHQTVLNRESEIVFARIRYQGSNIILGPHDAFEGETDYGVSPMVPQAISCGYLHVLQRFE